MSSIIQSIRMTVHMARYAEVGTEWSRSHFLYPHHRLYCVTDGEAEVTLKDRTIALLPGRAYWLPAFSMIRTECRERLCHHYIHFQVLSDHDGSSFGFYSPRLDIAASEETRLLFETAIRHFREEWTISSEFYIHGALKLLLAPFLDGVHSHEPERQRFAEVLVYIEQHLNEKISLALLAGLMNMAPVYFSNLFSRTFQMPPSQYIIQKRIEQAQLLLVTTPLKIKQIASEVGFMNEMYFCRIFKNRLEVTPSEYRTLNRY